MPHETESRDPSDWLEKGRGWPLRRTHNLSLLLDEAVSYDATLEEYRSLCLEVTAYYVVDRYPLGLEGFQAAELERNLTLARTLVEKLRRGLEHRVDS